jgi:hypothetical protein
MNKRDDIFIFVLAIALIIFAIIGISLVIDSTSTGLIVRWPI